MFKRVCVGVLIAALVVLPGLALGYSYVNPVYKVSPITDAKWAQLDFTGGVSHREWQTDKGPVIVDVPAFIYEGRTYVPFRWAVELFGGSAQWTSYDDGTTRSVILYAPEPVIETATVTNTITETVTVTNTVTEFVAVYPSQALKVVGSPTVYANYEFDKDFWGFYRPNAFATLFLTYPSGTGKFLTLPCDNVGYFQGHLVFNPSALDFEPGDWTLNLLPEVGPWISVTLHVVLPEVSP